MPKERIYGTLRQYEEGRKEQHDLLVQWSKAEAHHDRDDDGYSGMLHVAVVEHTEDTAPVWVHIDRTAANRMISALRRARDQAYGRDE